MADSSAAGNTAGHGNTDDKDQQIAALRGEIDVLRREVEDLRKPREVRVAALLSFVDVADAIASYPIGDPQLAKAVDIMKQRLDRMLSAIGFESIAAVGVPLDDTVHEIADAKGVTPPNPIVAAIRKRGFRAGDQIIRRAKVVASSKT